MTLQAGVEGLQRLADDATVGQVARAAYEAAMLGARGNSGVILSQLLRGFAAGAGRRRGADRAGPGDALSRASEVAYRGVSRPVEGTILTVAREAGVAAKAAAGASADLPRHARGRSRCARQRRRGRHAHAARSAAQGGRGRLGRRGLPRDPRRRLDVVDRVARSRRTPQAHPLQPRAAGRHRRGDRRSASAPSSCCATSTCRWPRSKRSMEALGESVIAVGDAGPAARARPHAATRPGPRVRGRPRHAGARQSREHAAPARRIRRRRAACQRTPTRRPAASSIGVIAVAAGEGLAEGLPQPGRARRAGRPDHEPQRAGDPGRGEQLGLQGAADPAQQQQHHPDRAPRPGADAARGGAWSRQKRCRRALAPC